MEFCLRKGLNKKLLIGESITKVDATLVLAVGTCPSRRARFWVYVPGYSNSGSDKVRFH
jgi:hypothetical protein